MLPTAYSSNKKIISERKRLSDELSNIEGVEVLPSDANFVFIKFNDKAKASRFMWELKEGKILVRHFSKPGLYEYLRISVGTAEENSKFLFAFKEIAKINL